MDDSQLQATFQQEDHFMDDIDWSEASHELPHPLLMSCPNWIRSMKSQHNATTNPLNHQVPTLDTNDLTEQQQIAYQIVSNHYTSCSEGHMPDPLLMQILGTAGTGKSFLIGTLINLLSNHCLITTTTGMAAYHIHGMTLHSVLQLPVRDHNCNDLQGSSLASLQQRLAEIQYIIIDEVSMLGQYMIAWVDRRLCQATGHQDKPFGGLSIILVGDLGQLPPVGDWPLYAPEGTGTHGHTLYHLFTTVVILEQVM